MSLLDSMIEDLLVIEPFWKICYPCNFHGFCCIGAKIKFSDAECSAIDRYVSSLSESDQAVIADNLKHGRHCIYRSSDKCLIHDARPENCQYTPFQYVVNPQNVLIYSMVRIGAEHCEFRHVDLPLSQQQADRARVQKFLRLPNFGRQTVYLSLNWYVAHS